ncbi:radical SAM protein [candidate division KSB3 bacterium]|nr:MAG: radical SAM protein [candidate division KSB3 bacterium]
MYAEIIEPSCATVPGPLLRHSITIALHAFSPWLPSSEKILAAEKYVTELDFYGEFRQRSNAKFLNCAAHELPMSRSTQKTKFSRILLVNPWIYDFSAFDLWIKPLGLLYVGGYLRQHGYDVHLIDCLDRHNPQLLRLQGRTGPQLKAYGTGKFFRRVIKTPEVLRQFPYPYRCYGLPEEIFCGMLAHRPRPDAILVTSMMTYWYPAVFRAIELLKQHFPHVPIILGGVYPSLCPGHAVCHSGADYVIPGQATDRLITLLDQLTGQIRKKSLSRLNIDHITPAYDLYEHLDYAGILSSLGCPFRCSYCASQRLCPNFVQREPEAVLSTIQDLFEQRSVRNFAFYDDALLVNFHAHLQPILEQLIQRNVSCCFHTPNGLHAKYINDESAELLFQAGFKTLRISLETIDPTRQKETGGKVTNNEFEHAVRALQKAGFQGDQIGVYLFIGLPGQQYEETEATIRYVHNLGLLVNLCEFSPIPGTREWTRLERAGSISANDDPLLHNNSIFLYLRQRYGFEQVQSLRNLIRALNATIRSRTETTQAIAE